MIYSNNSRSNRCAAAIPIIFVCLLIGVLGVSFGYLFNTKLFEDGLGGLAVFISIVFYINYIMIYWNYGMAIFTDPGSIKQSWSDNHLLEVKFLSQKDQQRFINYHSEKIPNILEQINSQNRPQIYKYCHRCNLVKPHRAHHCSQCKRCHLKMDHHCPWIGGCVGTYNHKFFLMFLVHAAFGTLFEAICILPFVLDRHLLEIRQIRSVYILMTFIFSLALACSLNVLMWYQMRLICTNLTTIEDNIYSKKRPSPFRRPKKCDNFKQVFGTNKCAWIFPIRPTKGHVDGHQYPYDEELLAKDLQQLNERDKMRAQDGRRQSQFERRQQERNSNHIDINQNGGGSGDQLNPKQFQENNGQDQNHQQQQHYQPPEFNEVRKQKQIQVLPFDQIYPSLQQNQQQQQQHITNDKSNNTMRQSGGSTFVSIPQIQDYDDQDADNQIKNANLVSCKEGGYIKPPNSGQQQQFKSS